MLSVNQLSGFGARRAGGGGTLATTFVTSASSTTGTDSYTFSSITLSAGHIVVGTVARQVGVGTITGLTVDGAGATSVVQSANSNSRAAIFIISQGSSTTGNVVVNWSGNQQRCGIGVWHIAGLSSATATDTLTSTANPPSGTMDFVAGGAGVGIGYSNGVPNTWTGLDEDFDVDIIAGAGMGGASRDFASASLSHTVTFDPSGTVDLTLASAAWGP